MVRTVEVVWFVHVGIGWLIVEVIGLWLIFSGRIVLVVLIGISSIFICSSRLPGRGFIGNLRPIQKIGKEDLVIPMLIAEHIRIIEFPTVAVIRNYILSQQSAEFGEDHPSGYLRVEGIVDSLTVEYGSEDVN